MRFLFCFLLFYVVFFQLCAVEPDAVRTIKLRQDDAQIRFATKLYELKNVNATDVLPFVLTAVQRYHVNSKVERVSYTASGEALLVSTGEVFLPYVDDLIKKIDVKGVKDESGSIFEGTGITRMTYTPQYRSALQFKPLIESLVASQEGKFYINRQTNTLFWQDSTASANEIMKWVKIFDKSLPQVNVTINYYELRDSTLRDIGFDYLAWKNGPGVNLLNVGYNAGSLVIDELFESLMTNMPMLLDLSTSWGYGGFFTAPQFDMSFIRILQQSGSAHVGASANLTMINTPVSDLLDLRKLQMMQKRYPNRAPFIYRIQMEPEYQTIGKNAEGRSFVGASFTEDDEGEKHKDPPNLTFQIVNPIVCFPCASKNKKDNKKDGGCVAFDYSAVFKNVVERNGSTGSELGNSTKIDGSVSLGFDVEKILAIYEQENDVEQTIGLPILSKIPYLRYLFSTTTTMKVRTYVVVTAEAQIVAADKQASPTVPASRSAVIIQRIHK